MINANVTKIYLVLLIYRPRIVDDIIMYLSNVSISSNSDCFCLDTILGENAATTVNQAMQKQNDGRINLYTVIKKDTALP